MTEELTSKTIYLRSHKSGQKFAESFANFISESSELVQRKVSEDSLLEYHQALGAALGESVGFLYFTRRERDKALGNAFLKYPKKIHNSEEQNALCRQEASGAIRSHELTKELMDALKVRIRICSEHLHMKAREA